MNTNQTDPAVSRFLEFRQAQAGENNGYIVDMLKFSLESGEMIAVYDHTDETDRFKAGKVIAMTEDDIILCEYSRKGSYDGFRFIKTKNIFSTECGGYYLENIRILSARFEDNKEADNIGGDDLVFSLLDYACKNRLAVAIEQYDSGLDDIRGFVIETGAENAIIDTLTRSGKSDCCTAVAYRSITAVSCDSEDEQILKFANENT
ncbi:MAG: hypothetical protein K2K57_12180 [Oscillospiraceae bacterium]|nr:hypothetical protein [Oscillospiraceae bacterium]